jgi:hypothetical protein
MNFLQNLVNKTSEIRTRIKTGFEIMRMRKIEEGKLKMNRVHVIELKRQE